MKIEFNQGAPKACGYNAFPSNWNVIPCLIAENYANTTHDKFMKISLKSLEAIIAKNFVASKVVLRMTTLIVQIADV